MRRTRGFTLLEVLIASALLGTVMAAAFEMFAAGNRQAAKGIASAGLLSSALQVEQRLMHDLQGVMMPTTMPAVVVDMSGTYLSFYVPDRKFVQPVFPAQRASKSTTETWRTTGTEVRWHLVAGRDGLFNPSRNDHVMKDVQLKNWRIYQTAPSSDRTTGTTEEIDRSPHPLPPELRQKLGLPKARLPRKEDRPAQPLSVPAGDKATGASAGATGGAAGSSAATPPTTVSTSAASSGATTMTSASYLLIEYTLVDPRSKQELKRSIVWDLVNVRSKAMFGSLYALPEYFQRFPPRRRLPEELADAFDRKWEDEPVEKARRSGAVPK